MAAEPSTSNGEPQDQLPVRRVEALDQRLERTEARLNESLVQMGRSEGAFTQATADAEQAAVTVEIAETAWRVAENRLAELAELADETAAAWERARCAFELAVGQREQGGAQFSLSGDLRLAADRASKRTEAAQGSAETALQLAREENRKARLEYADARRPDALEPNSERDLELDADSWRAAAQATTERTRLLVEQAQSMRANASTMVQECTRIRQDLAFLRDE